jgi:hypothetical protein
MDANLGNADNCVRSHVSKLMREVDDDRLLDLPVGPGRYGAPRIADRLVAIARWGP